MIQEKIKRNIKKLLFIMILILAIFLVRGSEVKAYVFGSVDKLDGTHVPPGIVKNPQPYYYQYDHNGEVIFCGQEGTALRRKEGSKTYGGGDDITILLGTYNDQKTIYYVDKTVDAEQSIAAAYYAYRILHPNPDQDRNNAKTGDRRKVQDVIWASGQWQTLTKTASTNTMPTFRLAAVNGSGVSTLSSVANGKYVQNLVSYSGKTTDNQVNDPIKGRGEAWANFYYKILAKSGMKLNIKTSPQASNADDLKVFVDSNDRSYTQGPYKLDLVDSNGNILTNDATEHYNGITLGTLVYNEICGYNPGSNLFQFCTLKSMNANVTYSDGSTQNYSVEVIDNSGNVIKFPKFGEDTYFRIKIPKSETRTVKTINYNLSLEYFTELDGTTYVYRNETAQYEVDQDTIAKWADSSTSGSGRGSIWVTNDTLRELDSHGVTNESTLLQYLKNLIDSVPNNNSNFADFTKIETSPSYDAYIQYDGQKFNSLSDLRTHCINSRIATITQQNGEYYYKGQKYANKSLAENAARADGVSDYGKQLDTLHWKYTWGAVNPIVTEDVKSHVGHLLQSFIETTPPTPKKATAQLSLVGTNCTMVIGGKVWVDGRNTKESKLNGRLNANADDNTDSIYAGMLVDLYLKRDGSLVASTTTDDKGSYRFDNLNALEKYIVKFTYNGQIYENTYYKEDLSGGYSNAKDVGREAFNSKFVKIDSSPDNYNSNGWKQAYALETKLKKDNGDFISDASGALTFEEAWNKFVEFAKNDKSYTKAYTDLENWLIGEGVGSTDVNGVVQYIKDCMIVAEVRELPDYDHFVLENLNNPNSQSDTVTAAGSKWYSLYTSKSDQSRNVDFGIYVRDTADLAIQKDVYKAIVRVNGKTHEYMYNDKDADINDDGSWNISVRASDYLYNGTYKYTREIRKSEYLYDGSIYGANGGTSAKDLQVYITYRIAVRNQSSTYDTAVNEIVDYYDKNEYEYDGSNPIINENTFVGNRAAEKIANLNVSTSTTLSNNRQNTTLSNYYEPLYLSGIKGENGSDTISTNGGMAFVYLTLKVKTHTDENGMDDRVQMDVDVSTGNEKGLGKRNLAELNGYSTYYKSGATIPDTLDNNNNPKDKDVSGNDAGLVDKDSNAGNLTNRDINSDGDLIISDDPVQNRVEDDTDKAPNIRLVFPPNDSDERTFTGYVFEDERNEASDKAVVGNGKYDNGETKINGVTVQLVELVQEVNVNDAGSPTGNYLGEYVWYARKYENGNWVDVNSSDSSESRRYYSGQKETVSPIISGPGATKVNGYQITEDGEYAFKSIPAGDFFIRFIYGDTTQTTLTVKDGEGKEVVDLLSGVTTNVNGEQGFISTEGLNAKSYNGQDYKSTTYQAGVSQTGSYNGINAYTNYDNQNYNITINDNTSPVNGSASKYNISKYIDREATNVDGKDKNVMYYYNIGESATQSGVSDAKDVGNVRDASNTYSKGRENIDGETHGTLVNARAEVLAAGLKVNSDEDQAKQVSMIKELMDNTAMTSQTGVINTEIEYNRSETGDQGNNNSMSYVIDDIDLGLAERPIAQLDMYKEVSNMKITLADGTILFDTGKSVTNVAYAEHEGHTADYVGVPDENRGPAYRLRGITLGKNSESTPELITTYMDEELMYGARIELTYTFRVTNVGEVDYMDKQFYYTGKSNAPNDINNISKSRADTVVDYVSNNLQFLPTNDNNRTWSIRTVEELTSNANTGTNVGDDTNLIHTKFTNTLNTYNAIVTTKALGDVNLSPEKYNEDVQSSVQTQMMLSSTLTPDSGDDSMVYNNLAEMVQVSNDQGRRMKFSIVGNQQMADQSLGVGDPANPDEGIYTKSDLVTPEEPDADSSQQVVILPPTGANKNYTLWIIIRITALVLIGGGIFLIKKKILKK